MRANDWKSRSINALVLCGVALAAGTLTILLMSFNLEAVGSGLVISLFALPAILFYALTKAGRMRTLVVHAGFWALLLPLPLGCFWAALFPSPGAANDGADDIALVFGAVVLSAGVAAYGFDRLWNAGKAKQA